MTRGRHAAGDGLWKTTSPPSSKVEFKGQEKIAVLGHMYRKKTQLLRPPRTPNRIPPPPPNAHNQHTCAPHTTHTHRSSHTHSLLAGQHAFISCWSPAPDSPPAPPPSPPPPPCSFPPPPPHLHPTATRDRAAQMHLMHLMQATACPRQQRQS